MWILDDDFLMVWVKVPDKLLVAMDKCQKWRSQIFLHFGEAVHFKREPKLFGSSFPHDV